jgi:hypothetical protein
VVLPFWYQQADLEIPHEIGYVETLRSACKMALSYKK